MLYFTNFFLSYFLVLANILPSSLPPGGSLYVSGKLPTCPSPKPTFFTANVCLVKGYVERFPEAVSYGLLKVPSITKVFLLGLIVVVEGRVMGCLGTAFAS